MLSFMREQGLEDKIANNESPAQPNSEQKSEQQYLTVETKNNNLRKSTILLAALFIAGLLGLAFMIKNSAPKTAAAQTTDTEQTMIEMAIARLTGVKSEMFSGIERIVKKFYEFSDVKQIRVNELVKNPFESDILLAGQGKMPDTPTSKRLLNLLRQNALNTQAKGMQLLSIIQSEAGNCCIIDDKILYEGDSIKDFYVQKIGAGFVELIYRPESKLTGADAENDNNTTPQKQHPDELIVLKLSE